MTFRNLTEVFIIMRNNATKTKNIYSDNRNTDCEKLLIRSEIQNPEEGLELKSDYESSPTWIDKLEEAQYTISKIKPRLDELASLHTRHLLRPTLDDEGEEQLIDLLSQEISKLITSTHRHIQFIRSSLAVGNKLDQKLTKNVLMYLLLSLQEVTGKFRNSQNLFLEQLNSREERSKQYFDAATGFATVELNCNKGALSKNNVEPFNNFLKLKESPSDLFVCFDKIDEHFERPISQNMNEQQLLLFEQENTKLVERREQEVSKIINSIADLNDIFKDLAHMVQEQGTILDRIDYNVEQTQSRVTDGIKQLHKAEMYQRKNQKIVCIVILAAITFFLIILLITTKF